MTMDGGRPGGPHSRPAPRSSLCAWSDYCWRSARSRSVSGSPGPSPRTRGPTWAGAGLASTLHGTIKEPTVDRPLHANARAPAMIAPMPGTTVLISPRRQAIRLAARALRNPPRGRRGRSAASDQPVRGGWRKTGLTARPHLRVRVAGAASWMTMDRSCPRRLHAGRCAGGPSRARLPVCEVPASIGRPRSRLEWARGCGVGWVQGTGPSSGRAAPRIGAGRAGPDAACRHRPGAVPGGTMEWARMVPPELPEAVRQIGAARAVAHRVRDAGRIALRRRTGAAMARRTTRTDREERAGQERNRISCKHLVPPLSPAFGRPILDFVRELAAAVRARAPNSRRFLWPGFKQRSNTSRAFGDAV